MISQLAYTQLLGKPLILYFGIMTFLSFLFTATIGLLNHYGNYKISVQWHIRMAVISIILALMHGLMGLSVYLGL